MLKMIIGNNNDNRMALGLHTGQTTTALSLTNQNGSPTRATSDDRASSVNSLLNPTDRVTLSDQAKQLSSNAQTDPVGNNGTSVESETTTDGAQPLAAGGLSGAKNGDEDDSTSQIASLRKQLRQLQKDLQTAQEELSQATSEAASCDDASSQAAADAKAKAAQVEVQNLNAQIMNLNEQIQEAMQA